MVKERTINLDYFIRHYEDELQFVQAKDDFLHYDEVEKVKLLKQIIKDLKIIKELKYG